MQISQPPIQNRRSPIRILMVCADFYPDIFGGLTRVIFELSRRLAHRGHAVFLTARRIRPSQPDQEIVDGIHVLRYDFSGRFLPIFHATEIWNVRRAVQRLLAEQPIDVLHVHQQLPGVGANLAPLAQRPVNLYSFYAPWSEEWRDQYRFSRQGRLSAVQELPAHVLAIYLRQLERFAIRRARTVVVLSDFTRQKAQQLHRLPHSRFHLIPGGVDGDHFKPAADAGTARAALAQRLGQTLGPEALLLLSVRRLVPRMGLENLIQAVASLRDRLPQLRLIIVGIGELESDLKALVNGLGVTNRVFFAGKVSEMDLPSYYQAADLFVLPTRALEGFGMVTLEALASGTPVLGTPVGGTVEILNRLNPDLLFADASPEAMAAKIGDFATSGKLTPRLRQACRDYALKHYSWDAVVAQYEALCRKLRDGTR